MFVIDANFGLRPELVPLFKPAASVLLSLNCGVPLALPVFLSRNGVRRSLAEPVAHKPRDSVLTQD